MVQARKTSTQIAELQTAARAVSTLQDILRAVSEFFAEIFGRHQCQLEDDLRPAQGTTLRVWDADELAADWTEEEVKKAFSAMAENKSSGKDGLPKELFEAHWDLLGKGFMALAKDFPSSAVLSTEVKEAVKILLHKKGDNSGRHLTDAGLKGKEWYMDSGCTQHMTNQKEWLKKFRASPIPYVLLGDERKLPVKGEGDLVLQSAYGEVKLDNVLLVDKLTLNLISQSQLDSGGCKTFRDNGSIWVFGSDWKVIAEGSRKQGLYEMKLHEKQSGEKTTYLAEPEAGKVAREELRNKLEKVPIKELQQQALPMAAAVSTVDVNLLHRRMGHAGHT
ncbi:unnamed protein product [Closterium sp. NIES-65]|nr:unnamed protein product [Closterium sp. NIES-65]CAI6001092.1 unnamed protein product [Closterium sp. NIES-65]CAI6001100.1 unnamed protein product [Closterium sp. NIES-65]